MKIFQLCCSDEHIIKAPVQNPSDFENQSYYEVPYQHANDGNGTQTAPDIPETTGRTISTLVHGSFEMTHFSV